MTTPTLKDQICAATDKLNETRRAFYQDSAKTTYDDVKAAAIALLELRIQAEKRFGRVRTRIDAVSIASLIR